MKLNSPEFSDGEHMPEKVGYKKENVNPELVIEDIPENTESLVLVMDDPDALEPAGKVWDHWTLWNISPDISVIEPGDSPGEEGMTDFGSTGYGGPNPPDGTHSYRFRAFALSKDIDLSTEATKEELLEEIKPHVIESDILEGKYDPI